MNWKNMTAASLLAALTLSAFAAHADSQPGPQSHDKRAQLDIKQVISIVEDANGNCGIVDARMTYLDSNGDRKVLDYLKFAACNNQGG